MTELPELSRIIDRRQILEKPVEIVATPEERVALSRRFALVRIDRLHATVQLTLTGEKITAEGRLQAQFVQTCAVSGDDLPGSIDVPLAFHFVPEQVIDVEELEVAEEELDDIETGKCQFSEVLDEFWGPFREALAKYADLLDRDQREQRPRTGAAVLLVVEEPEDPLVAEQLDDVPRELGRLVDLGGDWFPVLVRHRHPGRGDLDFLCAQVDRRAGRGDGRLDA